jgi:predicted NBD/HSP70 family sugar kinase
MTDSEKVILAVDIGGSKYMIGLISKTGDIIYKERYLWREISTEGVTYEILTAMEDIIRRFPKYAIEAVGMTIPGLADPNAGTWVSSSFLGIYNLPIAEIVHDKFGFPVFIDNDCRACALAEKWVGTCTNCNDFLYITLSNGVGGALVLNGDLYYGAFGNAGEVGQCVVVEDGRLSENGSRGILEMYAATRGVIKNYLEANGEETINGEPPNGESISRLAADGDAAALRAFELEGYYLGKVIADACNLLDLQNVIIGGGLSLAFEYYQKTLEETVKKNTFPRKTSNIVITPTILGYDGALIGAAALAIRGLAMEIRTTKTDCKA